MRFTASTLLSVIKTRSDAIYVFNVYFEESLIPAYIAGAISRRKVAIGVLDDWMRRFDNRTMVELVRDRIVARKEFRSTVRFMVFHFLRRFACRTSRACITSSRTVAEYAQTILRTPRVYVVGRAVEEFWFDCDNLTPTFDAIYVGRINKHKGIETLIQAWKIVSEAKHDASLAVVGSYDSENYWEKIRTMVKALGLEENVTFTGYIDDPERVRELLCSSKIFVFPSRREGFSNAVLQAMATGLPCVLSDIPALRELYSEVALMVTPSDPQKFAYTILDLLDDQGKRDSLKIKSIALARKMNSESLKRKTKFAFERLY